MYLANPPVHFVGNSIIAFFKSARSIPSVTISLLVPLYSNVIVTLSEDFEFEFYIEPLASTDPDAAAPS